ncbi:MAG TPA: alpha-glucosidase C-terminal domain-containing protein, partial [Anaerolineales bacterium]|nr:alpha-glucosidase C-terminal domain-containing protein [Anaerolineales bacterium]
PWDQSKWDMNLLEYAKACISLRKGQKALRRGEYKRVHAEDDMMAFARTYKEEAVVVAFNASNTPKSFEYKFEKNPRVLFGNPEVSGQHITVPPRSGVVLK